MKILIADDHPLVRRGIKDLLEEAFPEASIGEANDIAEAIEAVRRAAWDIVLLDLSMPGITGLEGLIKLKRACSATPILVLSMHSEEQYAVRALKSGAMGYLTKDHSGGELLKAIHSILAGRPYVSASLAQQFALNLTSDIERPLHERLSQREYRVMCLIASGQTVSQIAEQLHLSVKTISTYRARILEKMQMKSNAELMRYCLENRLAE